MLVQHRPMSTPNVDIQRQLVTLVHLLTKHLLLNNKMVPNAHVTSPDSYSECGYTMATSDTCTSFEKKLNYCTLIAVGALVPQCI